jgi:crotonobetainyl-CoA:carnitine CoA-transferase CaiB-like acyl-CoA transferase
MSKAKKPLAGIKILDLTWVLSGPFATSILLSLGAEVIKVEAPKFGDYTRTFAPFRNGASGYFFSLNRGKKSITLNLKTEQGKTVFRDLVKKVDVVTENFLPGIMDGMGLGYEDLQKINPRIIYGSIHGFGTFGPYAKWPAVDPVAQAMGGLMAQTGFADGPPLKTGPGIADNIPALYLVIGILTAILERKETGLGQRIEVSMMDAVFTVLEDGVIRASMNGEALPRRGNLDPLGAPWDTFRTEDGKWMMICTIGSAKSMAVFNYIGRDDIVAEYGGDDEAASAKIADNIIPLNQIFAAWAIQHTADEVIESLHQFNIPCGIVKEVSELINDPHLLARNMIAEVDHPKLGKVKTYNMPIMFNGHNMEIGQNESSFDPELGENNQQVLQALLGLSAAEVEQLYAAGALWKK